MKRYVILFILILTLQSVYSQDTIVTTEKDTIECKITRITDEFVHFSVFDKSGVLLMRSRLPLTKIESYNQADPNDFEESSDTRELNESDRIVLDDFAPASFRLSVNTGYTYQFGGYDGLPDSYKKQVQSLWNIGGDFHYFLSEGIGIGVKYNHIFTGAEDDFDPQIYGITTIRGEKIRFSYAAVSIVFRNFIYDDQVINFFVAGGIIKYKTDGLIDGAGFYEEGETFGLSLGITYDFLLTENFGVGFGAEINIASLSEIETNGNLVTVDFPLTRVDLTVGLRLFK